MKGRHGAEMTTNEKPLSRKFDSDKEKREIDSDLQSIRAEEIVFYRLN